MNQASVDDFTSTMLAVWYGVASQWMPPGDAAGTCEVCELSPLMDVLDVSSYPHDIVHDLAVSLTAAVEHVTISLAEEPQHPRKPTARQLVAASLLGHGAEISDVFENCIRYRLNDHLTMDLEGSFLGFA